jgi:hypothetical protein
MAAIYAGDIPATDEILVSYPDMLCYRDQLDL